MLYYYVKQSIDIYKVLVVSKDIWKSMQDTKCDLCTCYIITLNNQ